MLFQKKTATEWSRLVELYESRGNGVTGEEFCRTHRVAASTLDFWRRRIRCETPAKLVAVELAPADQSVSAARTGFALSLPNGRRIETTWRFADADLTRLIRIAESA